MTASRSATVVRLEPASDGALVRRHLAGDELAFDALYERFHGRLVLYCRQRVADAAAAEDLAQEVFVRALEALHRFDPSRPLWPWLKTIARRLAIDHARSHHQEEVSVSMDERRLPPAPPAHEEWMDLQNSLGNVNERHALALRLFYVEEWPAPDLCEFLGINRNALDQLLHRARARLREEYERLHGQVRGAIALVAGSETVNGFRTRMRGAVEQLGVAGAAISIEGARHVVAAALVGLFAVGQLAASPTAAAGSRAIGQTVDTAPRSVARVTSVTMPWEAAPPAAPAESPDRTERRVRTLAASSEDLVQEGEGDVPAPLARARVVIGRGELAIDADADADDDGGTDAGADADLRCGTNVATGAACTSLRSVRDGLGDARRGASTDGGTVVAAT